MSESILGMVLQFKKLDFNQTKMFNYYDCSPLIVDCLNRFIFLQCIYVPDPAVDRLYVIAFNTFHSL